MKAALIDSYGPPEVVRLEDVDPPVPKEDEVLVRVHATTVNRTDTGLRTAEYSFARVFTGLRRPRRTILGTELAGEVHAIGAKVTEFAVADRVFGIGSGTNAEFVRVRERGALVHMPASMSFEEAAAVPDGGCTALAFLRQVRLKPGQQVLVYGASGSIGTASVQLAKHFGAEVTAVCDTGRVDVVRSLGADHVIDRLREDFAANRQTYDVILDAVGKLSATRSRHSLKPGGVYVTAGSPGSIAGVVLLGLFAAFTSRKVRLGLARYRQEDVRFLKELVEAGAYRPVIDRTYPLEDVVEAHRYVDTEQKTGNVVLTIDGGRVS